MCSRLKCVCACGGIGFVCLESQRQIKENDNRRDISCAVENDPHKREQGCQIHKNMRG